MSGRAGRRVRGALTGAVALALGTAAASGWAAPAAAQPAAAQPAGHTVQALWFETPLRGTDGRPCIVEADLYTPVGVTPAAPAPAVISTHGFGGSKADLGGMARLLTQEGYVALVYSSLGFGGSTCKISLEDPDVDGRVVSTLVDYLGGGLTRVFLDPELRRPAPANLTVLTGGDPDPSTGARDPKVGAVGVSYGGAIQLAAASRDHRLDALIPISTWHDLHYALGPDARFLPGESRPDYSGATKAVWTASLMLAGVASIGAEGYVQDPARIQDCPNYEAQTCPALVESLALGTAPPATGAYLRGKSPATYLDGVRAPTLIIQSQQDTLFDLAEGLQSYRGLRANGLPVSMVWNYRGHSGEPRPGELDEAEPRRGEHYLAERIVDWFNHHLRDRPAAYPAGFSYIRDWVGYSGSSEPAYAHAESPELAATPSRERWAAAPIELLAPLPHPQRWAGPALASPTVVVGALTATVTVNRLETADPRGQVFYLSVHETQPNGSSARVSNIVPVRVSGTGSVTVHLPPIVHRFAAGSSVALELAATAEGFIPSPLPAGLQLSLDEVTVPVAT